MNTFGTTLSHLRERLPNHTDPETGIADVEALCGYLCAVITAPTMLMPSTWLPPIWGLDPPEVPEPEQRQFVELVVGLYQELLLHLSEPSEDPEQNLARLGLAGTMLTDPDGATTLARWAQGFEHGRSLDAERWDDEAEARPQVEEVLLIAEELRALTPESTDDLDDPDDLDEVDEAEAEALTRTLDSLDPDAVAALLQEVPEDDEFDVPDDDAGLDDTPLSPAERVGVALELSAHLHEIVLYNRAQAAARQTVRRATPKVGRNDPCPCGSGRKYKRCHGT